jgi:uncharacterized Ntn-hydrolase superfamily protein
MKDQHPDERCVSTFSIVGFDPATKEVGVAVQSKFLCCGSVVPWADSAAGAVATQSWSNTTYGPRGLAMLKDGLTPTEVMARLIADDEGRTFRQVGIVDMQGRSATYTGEDCLDWCGGIAGENFAAQGNILVGEKTVQALADTFVHAQGDLAERLTLALAAGQQAGGDRRGMQAAALYIVKDKFGYGGFNDHYIDIRVDDHAHPIDELRRLLVIYRLLFYKTKPGNVVDIEGKDLDLVLTILNQHGYYKGANGPWNAEMQIAFENYCLTENFDERMQPFGKIDKEVIDYLSNL